MSVLVLNKYKYKDAANLSKKEFQNKLAREGYSIFSWQDSSGAYYAPHKHLHDEFIIIWRGSLVFEIAGEEFCMEQGDELVIPGGTIHKARNENSETVEYFICTR